MFPGPQRSGLAGVLLTQPRQIRRYAAPFLVACTVRRNGAWDEATGWCGCARMKRRRTSLRVFANGTVYGRPCDILQIDRDSFLLTDDYSGVIYYVSRKVGKWNWLVDSEWAKSHGGLWRPVPERAHGIKRHAVANLMALIPLWGTKGGMHAVGSFR